MPTDANQVARAQSLGELLFRQSGFLRLPTERRVLLAVVLIFGILLFVVPVEIRSSQPITLWEAVLWNGIIRSLGAVFVFIGISGFLGRELIEVYEGGVVLRTSILQLLAGIFRRPPQTVFFRDMLEIFLNEDVAWPPDGYRTRKGALTGKAVEKARVLVSKLGGTLPIFAIRLKSRKVIVLGKSNIKDWKGFVGALKNRVSINQREYYLLA